MRDYLKLMEIEEVLERYDIDVEEIMAECRKEAQTCLCFAHCDSECVCGAWDGDDEY